MDFKDPFGCGPQYGIGFKDNNNELYNQIDMKKYEIFATNCPRMLKALELCGAKKIGITNVSIIEVTYKC